MASQGLVSTAGSASTGRAPALSSRVKQSCRLSKRCCLRVAQVEVGEQAPHRDRQRAPASGLRMRLNQPIKRVSGDARHAVGEQEVQVFLLDEAPQRRAYS